MVATPLGNLDDFSPRAVTILRAVDLILAEDTRHSRKLLDHFAITTPVQSYHEHNEAVRVNEAIARIGKGQSLALISDAGTPLINDPGYCLVQAAHAEGISVVPIPGPAAVIAALSVAGLPTDRFIYEGFLPARQSGRLRRLGELSHEERTMIFYEAPHRLQGCLEDMVSSFGGERQAVIAKELTKQHEAVRKDSLLNLKAWLAEDKQRLKGEFVLIVAGRPESGETIPRDEAIRVLQLLMKNMSLKQAVSLASEILGENKNRLYQLALGIKGD